MESQASEANLDPRFSKLDSIWNRLLSWMGFISAASMTLIILLTILNVLLRIGTPIIGVVELTTFLMIAVVYLSIAWTQKMDKHIGVDFITFRYPIKLQHIIGIINRLLGLFFFALIIYKGIGNAYFAFINDEVAYGQQGFYTWPARCLVPFGAATLCLQLLIDIIQRMHILVSGK